MEGRWTLMKDDELSSVISTLAVSACTGPSEVDLHIIISLTRKKGPICDYCRDDECKVVVGGGAKSILHILPAKHLQSHQNLLSSSKASLDKPPSCTI